MNERDWLAQRFQEHRPRLRALAYRMLGSASEVDDAVQEAWVRISRSNADEISPRELWSSCQESRRARSEGRPSAARPPAAILEYATRSEPPPHPLLDGLEGCHQVGEKTRGVVVALVEREPSDGLVPTLAAIQPLAE
jgi:Sigma-70 region 2